MYADLHCDTFYKCFVKGKDFTDESLHVNLAAVRRMTPCIQTFAHYVPENMPDKFDFFRRMLENSLEIIDRHSELVLFCSAADIDRAERQNKVLAVLSVEGGDFFDGGIDDAARVKYLACHHVRFLSLCYNNGSALCGGAKSDPDSGLTLAGFRAASRLAENGIMMDVSHLNHKSTMDILNSDLPALATHSNCFSVCPSFRNLHDEAIEKLIERESLMGINLYSPFLRESGRAELSDVIRHAEHVINLGGRKILALGADFDGCDDLPRGISGVSDIKKLDISQDMLYNNVKRFLQTL